MLAGQPLRYTQTNSMERRNPKQFVFSNGALQDSFGNLSDIWRLEIGRAKKTIKLRENGVE